MASKRANQELPIIARFEVRRRNCLAPNGSIDRPLPGFVTDAKLLVALYRAIVLLRLLSLAEPDGYLRVFLDAGEPIRGAHVLAAVEREYRKSGEVCPLRVAEPAYG